MLATLASAAAYPDPTGTGQAEAIREELAAFFLEFLITLIAVVVALLAIRRLVLWRLPQLMMKVTDAGKVPGSDANASWRHKEEVASGHPLTVQEMEAGEVPAEVSAVRERWVVSALAGLRKLVYIDVAVAAGYLLLPPLFGWVGGSDASASWSHGGIPALIVLLIARIRHFAQRHQLCANGLEREGPFGSAHLVRAGRLRGTVSGDPSRPLLRRALGWWFWAPGTEAQLLYSARVRFGFSAIFILWVLDESLSIIEWSDTDKAAGVGIVVAALMHATTLLRVWLRARTHSGARLLVLRVFGIDENARFTFGGVLALWQYFGNYFTVVDGSILRHELRLRSVSGLLIILGLTIGVFNVQDLLVHQLDIGDGVRPMVTLGLLIAGAALGTWWAMRWLDTSCIRSREHLRQGLKRLERRPRGIDLSYRPMQVICLDNTWRVAVEEFAQRADAVLMDLRGISASNQGCADEVDFLFDKVPLHKIVCIADAGTDRALVRRLLLERWQMLEVGSPNLQSRAPSVCLYIAHVQDPLDIRNILDLLSQAADSRAAPTLPPERLPAVAVGAGT